VLQRGGDDAAPPLGGGDGGATDGQVVGLGATGGGDDVGRVGGDLGGDLGASEIDGGGRPPAGRVVAGGVAVLVAQVGSIASSTSGATGVLALWSK